MKIEIILTDGAIKNNYINLRGHLDKFQNRFIGSSDMQSRGQALKLDIGGGVTFDTDVCGKHQRFRNRSALRALHGRHNFNPGDKLTIEELSCGHWKIVKA